jgi:ornithine cyclodeaminase/alanine dehydrogenase-like protein (mu-crystallin family)
LVNKASGRTDDKQITLFLNNVETGVQFAAVGYHAYCTVKEKGLGCEVLADWFLQDIRP